LSIALDAPPGLLPLLRGDPSRLRQVLFNLIGNAVKFTEQGGVQVRLALQPLSQDQVELQVAVQDTGIGIPDPVLPRIFDRFTQADSTTARRYGGSGLGLAISREIVQLMGGRIAARSVDGGGSRFEFAVPLSRAEKLPVDSARVDIPLAAENSTTVPIRHVLALAPCRILVAEDNAVNQILIKALLDRLGHYCDVVGNGIEAVSQSAAASYDLVLMDVQMPEMDGLAATREIRRRERELDGTRLPIVAMTASAMADDRAACLAAGMDDYLSKPIDVPQLVGAIARIRVDTASKGRRRA
jgi:CheY-like chemotaxis protein